MRWYNLADKTPPELEEVLVWIDGHRGAGWRNNHALVAYLSRGHFWEERHPNKEPLVGVIKWAKISIPKSGA
jgi:hypothetical protein